MWAYAVSAPRQLKKVEIPTLEASDLADGQVLIRMLAGGICGSDFFSFEGHGAAKLADHGGVDARAGHPSHEAVGEVLASRNPKFEAGARVVGWASELNGLAERVISLGSDLAIDSSNLPPAVSVMLQPLACVLYAVDQIPDVAGADVAVIGQGPIGILFSHVLKSRGARKVTGIDLVNRQDVAPHFGVDEPLHISSERWAAQLSNAERPQIVVEAVGHQATTLGDAIRAVAPLGQIYYFGIPTVTPFPFEMLPFLAKNLTLRSGLTLNRSHYLDLAGQYLAANPGLADVYVTNTFDIADVQKALETASVPAQGQLKVTLNFG
ncbi:MAG: hypothetical protein JWN95_2844 [Frankiales bacterium]|nr:hypothetical protein [Frankiales bacterium]